MLPYLVLLLYIDNYAIQHAGMAEGYQTIW